MKVAAGNGNIKRPEFQTASIDEQIRKLQERREKAARDAQRQSSNTDPIAAKGENQANRDAHNKIISQLDGQIKTLRSRKDSAEAKLEKSKEAAEQQPDFSKLTGKGRYVDLLV